MVRGAQAHSGAGLRAADLLRDARDHERAGSVADAVQSYGAAIAEAERANEPAVLGEALRRLAVVRHHRDETEAARRLCQRSYEVATAMKNDVLAAEALNTLGGLALESGELVEAGAAFRNALVLGGHSRELRARAEQNLGILANIHGDLVQAGAHYTRSLEAYRAASDEHGCAIAYHNLGMASRYRGLWDDAEGYFAHSLAIAQASGDVRLQGLCLVNRAEVHVARQRYDEALRDAEAALAMFDQRGMRALKVESYRVIGMVYRETGRPALAEARLRAAMELAMQTGTVLGEAEATRELALTCQTMGRNQEALTLLNAAHRLFRRLDARVDLVHVAGKVAELVTTYLAVARQWSESIESSDRYTFGHSARVATYACAVARALGLDDVQEMTIRTGAYLHDVGKVKVPHEILNKPGRLTSDELEIVRRHPEWGIELVANIDFPWDIKPIIRWHHEKYDGTGYPDRLRGDEIPLSAQIVCVVDVYDALRSARSYRRALSHEGALRRMNECRSWWQSKIYDAFAPAIGPETAATYG